MSKNNKGRDRWHGATPKTLTIIAIIPEPIRSLPSRQPKRGWQRGRK